MALPDNKISTTLVANTLGTSSRDVGTLCTHQAINKWSIPKPISLPILAPTLAQLKVSGFKPTRNPTPLLVGTLDYDNPKGGVNSPYRLGDFRGYDHGAKKPEVDNPLLVLNRNLFGDFEEGDDVDFYSVITNLDMYKQLATEGYRYLSLYETTNNEHRWISNTLIEQNMQVITGAQGTFTFSNIRTPNIEQKRTFKCYLSKADHQNYVDAQSYEVVGDNTAFEVSAKVTHEMCITSVVSVSRPPNPDPNTPVFPFPVEEYKYATTLAFLNQPNPNNDLGMRFYIGFDRELTNVEKEMFSFNWNIDSPYEGGQDRRIEIYITENNIRRKLKFKRLEGSYEDSTIIVAYGTVKMDHCASIMVQEIEGAFPTSWAALEIEFYERHPS